MRLVRIVFWTALAAGLGLVSSPAFAQAVSECPTTIPPAPAAPSDPDAFSPGEGAVVEEAAGPDGSALAALERERERARFQEILRHRAEIDVLDPIEVPLPVARLAEISGPVLDPGPPKVGVAIPVDRSVDFAATNMPTMPGDRNPVAGGQLVALDDGSLIWELGIVSRGAHELRVFFSAIDLAPAVDLWLYNEIGQVVGPYTGAGPDGNGEFWAPSLLGEQLRVHLRADSAEALQASHLVVARVMHLGSRVSPVSTTMLSDYLPGPLDNRDIDFCGRQVPDCTVDASCALASIPELANATNAVAHLRFVIGDSTYICTGALINQTGNGAKLPLLLTANHCFSTQAAASSLEAYFRYRSTGCGGTCPTMATLPRVNGSTLLATGASPNHPDFTLVRLSGFQSAPAMLLGWSVTPPAEGSNIIHVGHPAGAPQAYSLRRLRAAGLPYSANLPRPTFLYSGLASQTSDAVGATTGGSSGGPALLWRGSGMTLPIVGQLYGAVHPVGVPRDECDANQSTVDGSLQAAFPSIRRHIYDKIFLGNFQP